MVRWLGPCCVSRAAGATGRTSSAWLSHATDNCTDTEWVAAAQRCPKLQCTSAVSGRRSQVDDREEQDRHHGVAVLDAALAQLQEYQADQQRQDGRLDTAGREGRQLGG